MKPILRFLKKVDKANKIFIPMAVVESLGTKFYMEVYSDKVVLIPIK
jgi:hypothetical protein